MGGPPGVVPSPRASACTLSSDGGGRPLPAVRGARAGTPRCWQRPAQGPPGLPAGCTAGAWFILRHTGEPAKSAVPFPEGLTLLSAVQCPPPRL